jgi:hypothetical protein
LTCRYLGIYLGIRLQDTSDQLSKTCYDPKIDDEILKIIDRDKETRFNKLVVEIGEQLTSHLKQEKKNLKKTESIGIRRTIRRHLEFLSDNKNNILLWTRPTTPGKAGSIKYTPQAEIKRKHGFLTINYSGKRGICKEWKEKKENESKEKRRLKMILFLLLAMSYGYRIYEIPSKPQEGMILVRDPNGKQFGTSIRSSEEGFSPKDLDEKNYFSAFQDLLLWNRFTKEETKQIIDYFEEDDNIHIQRIIGKNNENEERFALKDEVLKELLIWCSNILKNIVVIIEEYWFISSKKPNSREIQWYSFVVGNERAIKFFQKIDQNRANKKTIEELYRDYKLRSNYVVNPKYVENKIKEMKKKSNQILTRKVMQEELFNRAFENKHSSLKDSIKSIQNNEKIQKLIKEEKYQWILKDLKYLINPDFLSKYYDTKLV